MSPYSLLNLSRNYLWMAKSRLRVKQMSPKHNIRCYKQQNWTLKTVRLTSFQNHNYHPCRSLFVIPLLFMPSFNLLVALVISMFTLWHSHCFEFNYKILWHSTFNCSLIKVCKQRFRAFRVIHLFNYKGTTTFWNWFIRRFWYTMSIWNWISWYKAFSPTWLVSMLINLNKRKRLYRKSVQLLHD